MDGVYGMQLLYINVVALMHAQSLQSCSTLWDPMDLSLLVVLVVKNPPANVGGTGSIPGIGRSPGEGKSNPYSSLA